MSEVNQKNECSCVTDQHQCIISTEKKIYIISAYFLNPTEDVSKELVRGTY